MSITFPIGTKNLHNHKCVIPTFKQCHPYAIVRHTTASRDNDNHCVLPKYFTTPYLYDKFHICPVLQWRQKSEQSPDKGHTAKCIVVTDIVPSLIQLPLHVKIRSTD